MKHHYPRDGVVSLVSRMSRLFFGLVQVKTWRKRNDDYVMPALW